MSQSLEKKVTNYLLSRNCNNISIKPRVEKDGIVELLSFNYPDSDKTANLYFYSTDNFENVKKNLSIIIDSFKIKQETKSALGAADKISVRFIK